MDSILLAIGAERAFGQTSTYDFKKISVKVPLIRMGAGAHLVQKN